MKNILIIGILGIFLFHSFVQASRLLQTSTGFYYPVNKVHSGYYLHFGSKNRNYGMSCHLANDYNVKEGTNVYSVGSGIVMSANMEVGNYGGDSHARNGGAIIIKHFTEEGEVFYALYGHVKNFSVSAGDFVKGGQKIAVVGPYYSGTTSLSHLHFGINKNIPSYFGYTPTAQCKNYFGFIDPEPFLKSHIPFDVEKFLRNFWGNFIFKIQKILKK